MAVNKLAVVVVVVIITTATDDQQLLVIVVTCGCTLLVMVKLAASLLACKARLR